MYLPYRALSALLLAATLCVGQFASPPQHVGAAAAPQCFKETGFCVDEPFSSYWRGHGLDLGDPGTSERESLALFGFPVSSVFSQKLEDGKSYDVQYFERVRMEYHSENAAPYDVLLGQFGRLLYLTDPAQPRANAATQIPGAFYFDATGHNLNGRFRDYWEANGGLTQFGYPITELLQERLENGQTYTVQYFERARFELHQENPAPYDVLLGQFGRRVIGALDPNVALPYLVSGRRGELYRREYGVRVRLMLPTGTEQQQVGVFQQFERGTMIWHKEAKRIYVFAKDAATSGTQGRWRVFDDTWTEGQEPGGGPAPVPNLFRPQRGFGKVWRDNPEVQQLVGYATTTNEFGKDLVIQSFGGGTMIEVLNAPPSGDYRYSQGIFCLYTNGRFEFRY